MHQAYSKLYDFEIIYGQKNHGRNEGKIYFPVLEKRLRKMKQISVSFQA